MHTIYNRFGIPELLLLENGRFINFQGQSIGFLIGVRVYDYRGRNVGWYENGILRDQYGQVVGFTEFPVDYPVPIIPLRFPSPPVPTDIEDEPARPQLLPSIQQNQPIKTFQWSFYTPINLFNL